MDGRASPSSAEGIPGSAVYSMRHSGKDDSGNARVGLGGTDASSVGAMQLEDCYNYAEGLPHTRDIVARTVRNTSCGTRRQRWAYGWLKGQVRVAVLGDDNRSSPAPLELDDPSKFRLIVKTAGQGKG